jgi:hypothetical protein
VIFQRRTAVATEPGGLGISESQPRQRIPELPRRRLTAPYHDPALNVIRAKEKLPAGQLAATLVKTAARLIKHARVLLAAVGREPSNAVVVWRHAAEDCDAAVASGIGGLRGGAGFGEAVGRERCLRNRLDKRHFLGVAWPRDAKLTHPGAAASA